MNSPEKEPQSYWKDSFQSRAQNAKDTVARNGFLLKVGTDKIRATVLDLIGPVTDQEILDAGCGDGSVSSSLTATNAVTGLDIVQGMLDLAAAKGLTPVEGSMEDPPFPAQSFDLVMSVEVISLSDQPLKVIDSLAKLVRPGGRLILSCVNKSSVLRTVAENILDFTGHPYPNAIRLAEMVQAVEVNGFEVKQMRAIVSGPGFARAVTPGAVNASILKIANNVMVEARLA